MEGLGYILVYFLKGSLPWMGIKAPTKKQRYEKVLEKKLEVSIEQLCRGLPSAVADYLYYVRSLRFDDEPDYGNLI